ncbi:MAG: polysaccharide deacetylase family protein [Parvularcula sp.]|jgi:peptidoglycan/xylan/chitin deacetylase (PgdA/CDA1 family)|nr:polysaccharide deacetylase family protein [Parvularcula sp.]
MLHVMAARRFFCAILALLVIPLGVEATKKEGEKRIALSFDDAPRPDGPWFTGDERAERLIASLARTDAVPSVFFVTTGGFEKESGGRERVRGYAEAGHLIGNHSHAHLWLHRTETEAYLADLDRAEDALAGLPNRRAWFRFPFLDEGRSDLEKRDAARSALTARGLSSGYVTVDTYDWHLADRLSQAVSDGRTVDRAALRDVYVAMIVEAAEHYDRMALRTLGRRPVQMLLLHENDPAAAFIADAVKALRDEGWTIVSPDEAYADPLAQTMPQTTFSGMGRIAALAFDQGARGADAFDHWSASDVGIDTRLEQAGAFGD